MNKASVLLVCCLYISSFSKCDVLDGPDPWNIKAQIPDTIVATALPPDLRTPIKKQRQVDTKLGFGEWWFKRLLAIMLKSGQLKVRRTYYQPMFQIIHTILDYAFL